MDAQPDTATREEAAQGEAAGEAGELEESTLQGDNESCESVEQSIISLVTSDFAMQVCAARSNRCFRVY